MASDSIYGWMRRHMHEHIDPRTRELNLTSMVEAWDQEQSTGESTLDQDHLAWEAAVMCGVVHNMSMEDDSMEDDLNDYE